MQIEHEHVDEDRGLKWSLTLYVECDNDAFILRSVSVESCVLEIGDWEYPVDEHEKVGWRAEESRLFDEISEDWQRSKYQTLCNLALQDMRSVA